MNIVTNNAIFGNSISRNAEDPVVKAAKVSLKRNLKDIKTAVDKMDELLNGASASVGKLALGTAPHAFLVDLFNASTKQTLSGIINSL